MISALSIPRRYAEVIPRSACPSWRWMTLTGHLNCVRVPQLVWREAASDPGRLRGGAELAADPGGRARSTPRRAAQHAEQRSDGQINAELDPGVEVLPCPAVHPDLATFAALSVPDRDRTTHPVKIAFGEGERFADPEPGTPQHDDHTA
jgi:hypothetical protein